MNNFIPQIWAQEIIKNLACSLRQDPMFVYYLRRDRLHRAYPVAPRKIRKCNERKRVAMIKRGKVRIDRIERKAMREYFVVPDMVEGQS